jgi:TIR domain
MAIQPTTEFAATSPDVTRGIVQDLRKSDRRYKVFQAVYSGGNKPKDARVLATKTGLTEMAVLQLATPMAHKQYFEQLKYNGRVAFRKYQHINAVRQTILRAAKSTRPARGQEDLGTLPKNSYRPTRIGPRPRSTWKTNPAKQKKATKYDVFVCHASEDKGFVDPLVAAAKRAGIRVWYDKDFIVWGDGLRASIDRGLANSRFGIVVFSKAFLTKKHWTEHELNGLSLRREVVAR